MKRVVTRREFLRTAAAATGGLLLGRAGPAGAVAVDTLPAIPERASAGGLLDTTMQLAFANNTVGPYDLHTRTFDGGISGPTLRLAQGDRFRIAFTNAMPPNTDPIVDHNIPHHFNSFVLHTHGLHVDPTGNSDNVFVVVEPGDTYTNDIQLPADHPAGMYWYHPHKHGAVRKQIMSGMSGPIVIEGPVDAVPEIAAARERVILIQELRVNSGTGAVSEVGDPTIEDLRLWLLNGEIEPTLVMQPGEVVRLRFVYAGLSDTRDLTLDGHDWVQVAQDGITFAAPVTTPAVSFSPGNRADLLVRGGAPGEYPLRFGPTTLGTVEVDGAPVSMDLPASLPGEPRHPTVTDGEIHFRRTVTFGVHQGGGFDIDGRLYDRYRVEQAIPLGNVEEWTVLNQTPVNHPFHIHTNPFELTQINGVPLATKVWMDVVDVPPGGSVTFRIRFEDFVGKSLLHCHILGHGDAGMMQNVLVWEPGKVMPGILDLLLGS